jgi:hypothetical protein
MARHACKLFNLEYVHHRHTRPLRDCLRRNLKGFRKVNRLDYIQGFDKGFASV